MNSGHPSPHDPTVSVVMSVRNGGEYLAEAIDSVLAQTFQDFEFLILDNQSTDESPQIIDHYKDARIRYIRNEEDLGLTRSLNRGIELARGRYIARMDADDIACPERFELQVRFLEVNSNHLLVGGAAQRFGSDDLLVRPPLHARDILPLLPFRNCFVHSTVMMRTVLPDGNRIRYDERFRSFQDYPLWWKCALRGMVGNLPEVLVRLRVHDSQESHQQAGGVLGEEVAAFHREMMSDLGLECTPGEVALFSHFFQVPAVTPAEIRSLYSVPGRIARAIAKALEQRGYRRTVPAVVARREYKRQLRTLMNNYSTRSLLGLIYVRGLAVSVVMILLRRVWLRLVRRQSS